MAHHGDTLCHPYPATFPSDCVKKLVDFGLGRTEFVLCEAMHHAWTVQGWLQSQIAPCPEPHMEGPALTAKEAFEQLESLANGVHGLTIDWQKLVVAILQVLMEWFAK